MRFSEIFKVGDDKKVAEIKSLADIGAIAFGTGITDKNEERTPHYEISKCIEMYENNPIVNSGINQMLLWLFPNNKIKIYSEDEKTRIFLEQWHEKRKGILNEYRNMLLTNIICGNAPVEYYRSDSKIEGGVSKKVLDNIFSFNDMSRIYRNVNASYDGHDAFIFELKFGTKSFTYRGKILEPTYYQVSYIKNYQYIMANVYGIPISKDQMRIYMSGWSRDNLYGRSQLASAIDAHNVYSEIINSWDTIARTRQIDQKIISLADNQDGSIDVSQERLDELGQELEDNDKSYVLFNVPLKFVQQDVDVSGKYDLMEGVFDLCRRMLIMSLLPQHLTPWSDSATTQGSESSMPPFMSRLKSKQNEFINWHKENILDELIEQYNLSKDARLEIDEPKIMPDDQYIRTITELMREQIIDKEQAREYLGKLGIIDMPENNKEQPDKIDKKLEMLIESSNPHTKFQKIKKNVRVNKNESTRKWKELKRSVVGGKELRVIENESEYILFEDMDEVKRLNKKGITKQKLDAIIKSYKAYLKNTEQ